MITIGIILAIAAAATWSVMYMVDKYAVAKHVKNVASFSLYIGLMNILIGAIIAAVISWDGIKPLSALFAIASGACWGISMIIHYRLLSKYDVSDVIGLTYLYPVFTAILAFFLIHEVLTPIKYIAVVIVVSGLLLMTVHLQKLKQPVAYGLIFLNIVLIALYQILLKMASDDLTSWQGTSLNTLSMGIVATSVLLFTNKNGVKSIWSELKNIKYAALSEIISTCAILLSYVSLFTIPATMFASIDATQPIFLLIFENIISRFEKTVKYRISWYKLIGVILIVIGVSVLVS